MGEPVVAERHVLEAHLAPTAGRQADGTRAVDDLGLGLEDLVDALGRRLRSLRLGDEHAGHPQRPDEHEDVGIEGGEPADREMPGEHLVAPEPDDHDQADRRQQVEHGDVRGPNARR